MIPRSQPPFNIRDVLRGFSPWSDCQSVEGMEKAWADYVKVPYAILVPSGRAGICWTLRAAIDVDIKVLAPAYTCRVVHEALAMAGVRTQLIDVARDGVLMDHTALRQAQKQPHALVLCELFGFTYDPTKTSSSSLRIFDMAMTVPHPSLFKRLKDDDMAIISFGLGKCIYSGWGGMCFTRNKTLAEKVRKIRADYLHEESLKWKMFHNIEVLLRTAAHMRSIYGAMRRLKEVYCKGNFDHDEGMVDFHQISTEKLNKPYKEYTIGLTSLDRFLALHNLHFLEEYHSKRIQLARRYASHFSGNPDIKKMPLPENSISHYVIRVSASKREAIRRLLWRAGIDTGVLFPFHAYLSPQDYPQSKELGAEILNLPLDHRMKLEEVDYIANKVSESVQIDQRM
jgi:dTDP-4-amino-4,6-dideoxygalactose transaminase